MLGLGFSQPTREGKWIRERGRGETITEDHLQRRRVSVASSSSDRHQQSVITREEKRVLRDALQRRDAGDPTQGARSPILEETYDDPGQSSAVNFL